MHYKERLPIIQEKPFHFHFQTEKSPRYTGTKKHLSENKALINLSESHLLYFYFSYFWKQVGFYRQKHNLLLLLILL